MEKVCFSFASQRQHFIVPDTVGALTNSMNLVLRIDPSECHFIKCEEVASNWFNLMFELPNRREVVDKLCLNALEKEPWLAQCGVRAVKIGDKSEIHMQTPITRSVPTSIAEANVPTSIAEANLPCSQGRMLPSFLLTAVQSLSYCHLGTEGGEGKVPPSSWFCQWTS